MTKVTHQRHNAEPRQRLAGAFILALVLSLVLAPAASAAVGVVESTADVIKDTTEAVKDTTNVVAPAKDSGQAKDPGQTVKDTSNKVGETATDTGGKVGDTATNTGGKVGDAVGGPVGGAVKDTTDKVGSTVKDGTKTTGDAITKAGESTGTAVSKVYNDTMDTTAGLIGGDGGKKKKGKTTKASGKITNGNKNDENVSVAAFAASREAFPLAGAEARYIKPVAEVPALETASRFLDARTPQQFFEAAVEAAKRFAFPLALTILVVAFLLIQNKIDSKDPKLAMASVDLEEDLLSFS